ncbi:MAG: hypothetical protein J6O51_01240 [Bacteroidales bacterium]|nr:hypothetical protein [Bacteroidales bacterium]
MRKFILYLITASAALVSCGKEIALEQEKPADVVFNLDAIHPDGLVSKAVKTGWEPGDVIFVIISGDSRSYDSGCLEMKWDGTQWDYSFKFALELQEGEEGTMRAIYLPFDSDASIEKVDYSYNKPDFKFVNIACSYYLTDQQPYQVKDGSISGTFNMQVPEGYVQFFLDNQFVMSTDEVELREPHLTPQYIEKVEGEGVIHTKTLAHGAPLPGYIYDKADKTGSDSRGWLFSGILAEDARGKSIDYHFTRLDGEWYAGNYYIQDFAGKTLYTDATHGRAIKLPSSHWASLYEYRPIDIGCDVNGRRIYWCSRNIGATSSLPIEDTDEARKAARGNFYNNWGEAEEAVKGMFGPQWRLPTKDEWETLRSTSNSTWTKDDTKNGYIISSRKGFPAELFFPFAGWITDSGSQTEVGAVGLYWSSTPSGSERAYYARFRSGFIDTSTLGRANKLSVRAVCE